MELALLGQAIAVFAVTNVDDLLVLAVLLGEAGGRRRDVLVVVGGQYLGFAVILALSVAGSLGARLLPEDAAPYLGVVPLTLGVVAGWRTWRRRRDRRGTGTVELSVEGGPGLWRVTAITVANGGDNVGVYVPLFAAAGPRDTAVFVAVSLVGVAVWCAAGAWLTSRPVVARTLTRWGDVLLPLVLVAIGLVILVEGGVLGP